MKRLRFVSTGGAWAILIALASLVVGAGQASAATLLHYDFSDGSGGTVTDLSGNGNDGTLVDVPTTAGSGVYGVSEGWVTGGGINFLDTFEAEEEANLPTNSSHISTPLELAALGGGDVTVEYKASYSGSTGWTPAIGSSAFPFFRAQEAFFLGIRLFGDDPLSQNEVRTPGINFPGPSGGIGEQPWFGDDLTTESIHHITMTFDYNGGADTFPSQRVNVFIDGVWVGGETRLTGDTGTFFSTSFANASDLTPSTFRIAGTSWSPDESWAGVMYGVAISNTKLFPDEFVLMQYVPEPSSAICSVLGLLALAGVRGRW